MSEPTSPVLEPQPDTPQGRAWLPFFAGSSVLALLGLTAAFVLMQFMQHRPTNMQDLTRYLAGLTEETLRANYIPAENIHAAKPELREDDERSYYYHSIEVELPLQVNAERVAELIRTALQQHLVKVADAPAGEGFKAISLSTANVEFARLTFREAKAPENPVRADLRPDCYRIAREVEDYILRRGGMPPPDQKSTPVEHEDENTLWATTSMFFALPAITTPMALRDGLAEVMSTRSAEVSTGISAAGERMLRVHYANKLAVEALLTTATVYSNEPSNEPLESIGRDSKDITMSLKELAARIPHAIPLFEDLQPETPGMGEAETAIKEGEEYLEPAHIGAPEGAATPPETPEGETPGEGAREGEARPLGPAKLAIVLDDGGYHDPAVEPGLNLDPNLTLAILPHTPFCLPLAEAARAKGFQIILHLPMESKGSGKPFPGQLRVEMTEEVVRADTDAMLGLIPGIVGVNNHTGSRFTEDRVRMKAALEVVQQRGLYFLDSRTSSKSKGVAVARELGLPHAGRDIFLDNSASPEAIRRQLQRAVHLAQRRGVAVAIGHFRSHTVAVLAEELPKLAEQGVILAHVSDLLQ